MTFDILSRRTPVSEIIDRIYRVVLVCCASLTCGGCTVQSDGAHSTRDSKTTLEREREPHSTIRVLRIGFPTSKQKLLIRHTV